MVRTILVVALLSPAAPADFDDLFTGATLRLDYYHSGAATEEHISLDAIRQEGEWPGRPPDPGTRCRRYGARSPRSAATS